MPGSADRLRDAARADGLVLRDDAMSLAELDGLLSAWRYDDVDRPWLVSEVGSYLAAVLLTDVPTASAGDGDTVLLGNGDLVDCAAVAAERVARPNADLRGVVRDVHARPTRKKRWWRRG
ncbi:DUF6278 family protein [Jatrophihabitans sp. YIM 134969]